MKIALSFSLTLLLSLSVAHAEYVDEYGVTDYGLAQDTIVNGTEVPSAQKLLRSIVLKIKTIEAPRGTNGIDGTIKMGTCTGTLIAPQVVLTAAHCFIENQDERGIAVHVGDKLYPVKGYARHPHFKNFTVKYEFFRKVRVRPENDIALVFLAVKVPQANPALLPPAGARIKPEADVILTGYGSTGRENKDAGGPLRWTTAKVAELDTPLIEISGSRTICDGDSGGPGLVPSGNRFMVLGVSTTSNCRDVAHMTRVSDYISWIRTEIAKFNARLDI